MTPRPSSRDPSREVVFGRWPLKAQEGIVPDLYYRENPPDPARGATLLVKRGKRWYYKKLRKSDQLSQAEAAAFLGVSRMQVNRWVRSGELRDRKVLGTSRIQVGELIRFGSRKRLLFHSSQDDD
jgi:excisionase family DNA binding protein